MQEQGTQARDFISDLFIEDRLLSREQIGTLRGLIDPRKILYKKQQEAIRIALAERSGNPASAIILVAAFINSIPQ